MSQPQIRPEKIATPIQLLAAVLAFGVLVDTAFLAAASSISKPSWAAGVLVVGAVIATALAPATVFRLQTKHRTSLLADKEYARLEGRATRSTQDARELADVSGEPLDVYGNPDQMTLLFKAEGRGWLKSTKAMNVPGGCLVQVSTEVAAPGGVAVAESLEFIPNATVETGPDGGRLTPSEP